MRKIWIVAMREYWANIKSKGFLVGVFLVPVFMFGGIIVIRFTEDRGDSDTKRVAVIDHSGAVFAALRDRADRYNRDDIFEPETGRQRKSKFEFIEIEPAPQSEADAQLLTLSDRVREDEYFAFVEIDANVLDASASSPAPAVRYHTNQSTYRDLPRWLSTAVNEHVRSARFADAGLDRQIVDQALRRVGREDLGLLSRTDTGEIKQAERSNILATLMVPFAILMFMFMSMMVTTQPLLHGVLEEKMKRIAEVLLGSIRPFDLMLGKLVGNMLLALTLIAVYFAAAGFVAGYFGKADLIEPGLIAWFLVFMVLGVFMFGSLFLAVGSCCNDIKESQSLIMPVMFPMIIPMMLVMPIVKDPNGTFATVVSLVPFWTPMVMSMRLATSVVVPYWQPPVAMAGCVIATLVCVWMAGRIFRVGLLMQGKPPKIGDLVRWAIRG